MQAQLSTLPPSEHEAYAGALATLDVAFRDSKDADMRQRADEQLSQLGNALLDRATTAGNDPVEQRIERLQPSGRRRLSDPTGRPAATQRTDAAARVVRHRLDARLHVRLFRAGSELKNDLQRKIATAIDQHTKQEAGKWAARECGSRPDRPRSRAIKDDPGKRYELIGRQLFSINPGSGRDDLADRRLLAFTQRMQDDPCVARQAHRLVSRGRDKNSTAMASTLRKTIWTF